MVKKYKIEIIGTIIFLIAILIVGLVDQPPVEHCDGDFCYRNGYIVDEHGNYSWENENRG